jgi:hypothetical protein
MQGNRAQQNLEDSSRSYMYKIMEALRYLSCGQVGKVTELGAKIKL